MHKLEYTEVKVNPNSKRFQKLANITEEYFDKVPEYSREDFSKEYAKNVSDMVTGTYIDLPMLLDIYLGGLLLMTAEDPSAFSHIVSNIKKYHSRLTAGHAEYFPALGITEEQLMSYITDPKNCSDLLLKSPPTTFWPSLRRFHDATLRENRVMDGVSRQKPEKLRYVVNTWPLTPSIELARLFKLKFYLGIKDSDIRFGLVSAPSHELDVTEYRSSNYFFVYRFNPWVENEHTTAYKCLVDQTLEKASIVATPCITNSEQLEAMPNFQYNDFVELEKANLLIVNMYTSFQYYRPLVAGFEELLKTANT